MDEGYGSAVCELREREVKYDEDDDRFRYLIGLYIDYMNRDDMGGYLPSKAAFFGKKVQTNMRTGADDSDIAYEFEEKRLARVVEACVQSLEVYQQAAIWRAYGISAVWTFKRIPFDVALTEANEKLRELVLRRC